MKPKSSDPLESVEASTNEITKLWRSGGYGGPVVVVYIETRRGRSLSPLNTCTTCRATFLVSSGPL